MIITHDLELLTSDESAAGSPTQIPRGGVPGFFLLVPRHFRRHEKKRTAEVYIRFVDGSLGESLTPTGNFPDRSSPRITNFIVRALRDRLGANAGNHVWRENYRDRTVSPDAISISASSVLSDNSLPA